MGERRALGTPTEVAAYLQKPVRTLEQWRYRGEGPKFTKVGQSVRYRWTDVDKWLDDQTAAVGGDAA